MNIFPSIKLQKKRLKFTNPLAGMVYHNNEYLKQCNYGVNIEKSPAKEVKPYVKGRSISNIKRHGYQSKLVKTEIVKSESEKKSIPTMAKTFAFASETKANRCLSQTKEIFIFPDVEIRIIDQMYSIKDITKKCVKVNLTNHFNFLFTKPLAGVLAKQTVELIEKYMQILVEKKRLDFPVDINHYPSDLFNLTNKRSMTEKILELEEKKNFKPIQQMIKYYCVSPKEIREKNFSNIIQTISQSLYEKFNMSKQQDYVLLDQNGRQINEMCAIKPSAKVMLISVKQNSHQSYQRYTNLIQNKITDTQKMNFLESLKKNFREKTQDQQDENSFKFDKVTFELIRKRKTMTENYQPLFSAKREVSSKTITPNRTNSTFYRSYSNKSKLKARETKSVLSNHESSEPQLSSSIILLLQKQKKSLSFCKRQQKYISEFKRLQTFNNNIDMSFNHNNENQLLLPVFLGECSLCRNKSSQHIHRILEAFGKYPQDKTLSLQEFISLNQISNCKGDQEKIIKFIVSFLKFNQFGELSKNQLKKSLQPVLPEEESAAFIVSEIVWNWLQRNDMIHNQVLSKSSFEGWFNKNKMAFAILTSFIFGEKGPLIDIAFNSMT